MTFEEFFTKKRIDLAQLRRAEPVLYEEFRDHYAQMSEKSFDHTKKYWFNRLRKDFLLEVVEAPKVEAAKAATSEGGAKASPAAGAPVTKPAGFKPRFKPNAAKPAATIGASEPPEEVPEDSKLPVGGTTTELSSKSPAGFKPRFKAGVARPATQKSENDEKDAPETPEPLGFKPRFKAGKTANKKNDGTS